MLPVEEMPNRVIFFPPRNDLGYVFKRQASGFHPRHFDSLQGRGSQEPGFANTLVSGHVRVGQAGHVSGADWGNMACRPHSLA